MSSGRSPPQDAGSNAPGGSEPFYTNEDVAVLHNIVLLAEELLPGLPERERLPTNALFSAYFDILPRVGVNADHDSRYARILFKIGGLRGPGTIYEKFEEILSRMGIEIEFDDHEKDEDPPSQSDDSQADAESEAEDEVRVPRGRQRRNSESSAWDIGTGFTQPRKDRPNSVSSLHKYRPRRNSINDVLPPPVSHRNQNTTTNSRKVENERPMHTIRTWLASSQQRLPRDREISVSRPGSLQIHRRSPEQTHSTRSDDFQAPSEITAVTSVQEQLTSGSPQPYQEYSFNNTSGSLMQVKASLILQHHLSFLAKRQLRLWRNKALQIREDNVNSNLIALHHDKKALLQLALETWHQRLLERQQIAETERFFAHLEQRSDRARDLYLLHKAFTHWGSCAYEEAQRTLVARRHIIRTRTFNAWRDITIVNELKVRRHIIKKFFALWKRQHHVIHTNNSTAVQKFEGNLVEKSYRLWILKGWDIKAAIWWEQRTKQQTLSRWGAMLRVSQERCEAADEQNRSRLLWGTYQAWKHKTEEDISNDQEADKFYQLRISSNALGRWRGEIRVLPAKNILQTDISSRLLRETFEVWLHHTRQERNASAIDRLRILREAWTTWRHRVRSQVIRTRVDGRVIQEAIYKWILGGRIVLAKRNANRALLRNCLELWVQRERADRAERWNEEGLAQSYVVEKTRSLNLSRWRSRLKSQQQSETNASEMYNSTLLHGVLSRWSGRTEQVRHLQQWSRDAEFYFLASKTLKRWKTSTESAKREKRKTAYAQVRRMTKMKLARGVLLGWREQAQRVLDLEAQAQEISQNKTVIVGMNVFDHWRARTEELRELEPLWQEKVLRKQFSKWKARLSRFQEIEIVAIVNYQERQQLLAFKKWNLLRLQLRSRSHYATEIREMNLKRTFRKMFDYWQQRTLQKRPVIRAKESEQEAHGPLGATARAEAWSDFGDETEADDWLRGLDDGMTSTPVPGYLNTPSKRAQRVTAATAIISSTTPKARLSTPFERHLRAGGLLPSTRRPLGRSKLGMGGGFANIQNRDRNDEHDLT